MAGQEGSELIREIDSCRSCGFSPLGAVFSLGDLHVSNFVDSSEAVQSQKPLPLELVLCDVSAGGCGLLQLKHTVSPEMMYRNYWYRSGGNRTMSEHLAGLAKTAETIVRLGAGDLVVDIGANDGTLLRAYRSDGIIRVGFEPAANLVALAENGTDKIFADFFAYAPFEKEFGDRRAKIITAIAMFYDLDRPNRFVADVKRVLDPDGVFVIEMHYLPSMLTRNSFDAVCVKPETLILGDNKPIRDISGGEYAVGADGNLTGIKRSMRRRYQGNLIRIQPKYLEPVTTTPEHPIRVVKKEWFRFACEQLRPTSNRYRVEWVLAASVRRGDYVVVPRLRHGKDFPPIDLTEFNQLASPHYRRGLRTLPLNTETAWLLGIFVAEGHVGGPARHPYIDFTLNKTEQALADRISAIFQSLGYATLIQFPKDRNSMEIRANCAALARALIRWVRKGAVNKCIPDFILFAPEEIKIAFLRGLFAGDGYIKGNKIHFHTSSKVLALQTQLLVASLGGMLGMSYVKPYPRTIRGGEVKSKDSWQLRGSSKILANIFGYEHHGGEIEHFIVTDDYIFVPVKHVNSELYHGEVYNIETKCNTYLVSNAVVHNCHEHLEYYALGPLEHLLGRHGLEVFDAERNAINGGSFRAYTRHKGSALGQDRPGAPERVEALRLMETEMGLDTRRPYEAFKDRIHQLREKLYKFIKSETEQGKKIYVYGASTKGNTLLQFCNLDHRLIPAAAERNPMKWGKRTIATNIAIISEEEARAHRPDYFLVLPWHFLDEFKEREADYLRAGGKFIVPLPEPRVVGHNDEVLLA